MDFSIRPAAATDHAGLNGLFEELDEHHRNALPHVFRQPEDGTRRPPDLLSGILADKNALLLIAESQNQVVGLVYAYLRSIPETPIRIPCRAGEVDQIIVKRQCRRSGIGTALMAEIDQWARRMELDRLELSVWCFNEEAREFYRKLGYEPVFVRMWK